MNIFTIFLDNISAKYAPKRTKLHYFEKISRGSMPPNPPKKKLKKTSSSPLCFFCFLFPVYSA